MPTRLNGKPAAPAKAMSYAARAARYEHILALRSQDPPLSYEDIADLLRPKLTRARVQQIAEGGVPQRSGRPPSAERRATLVRKLGVWELRLRNRRARGEPEASIDEATRRIAELQADLRRMGVTP